MKSRINFIIPLSGRVAQFHNFINNLENSFLKFGDDVSLLVVLFWKNDGKAERDSIATRITDLKLKFPHYWIQLVERQGNFNRGVALNIGATYFKENDLLFFVDVDCYVDRTITERIQRNTVRTIQAYFPIMFSLYDPHFVWDKNLNFSNEAGYWRFYSYGQVSVYKSDFIRVSGYDTSITGWGKEDIDFFQRVLDKHIIAFRAPDPGLVHIFHEIHCGLELPHEQYRMCLGTKWSTYGSKETLVKIVHSTKDILNRNSEE